jgi:hypothetical protein
MRPKFQTHFSTRQHPTPVFIVGSGRSGTTITATLLSHLSRVQISKETGYISQNIPLLKDINSPAALKRLIVVVNQWLRVSQPDHLASLEGFQQFCGRYDIHGSRAFIHYIWQLDSPKPWHELSFIGDNTPLYLMAIPVIQEFMPDARFIHVVRDPRDVVTSTLKMRFGADDPIIAALEWHTSIGCWLMAERIVTSDRRMECRYEDLCTAPEETMTRLAAFLNHSKNDAMAALTMQASSDRQKASGFESVASAEHHHRLIEPVAPSRVGRYKSELTAAQIQSIETIAQYGMLAYGYEPTTWHEHPMVWENRVGLLRAMIRDVTIRCLKRIRGQ